MKSEKPIAWWEPFASCRKTTAQALSLIFTLGFFIRTQFAFIGVFVLAFHALRHYLPGLEFDWTNAFIKCQISFLLILGLGCIQSFIPPCISISSKGIIISKGQQTYRYRFQDLAELKIIEDGNTFPMIVFRPRDRFTTTRYAISKKIPLDVLRAQIENWKGRT